METKEITLEQIKEAGRLLDDLIVRYYQMVFDYYGVPRKTCELKDTVHEQAKQFRKRFNLDLINEAIKTKEELSETDN